MAVGGLPADQLLQEAGVGPHPGSDGGHVVQRRGQGAVVPATQYTAHEENMNRDQQRCDINHRPRQNFATDFVLCMNVAWIRTIII